MFITVESFATFKKGHIRKTAILYNVTYTAGILYITA
jgi:hypothetical protein